MSTILIYTSPARGHLYPMMDIAVGLKSDGHRVIIQTLSAEKKNVIAEGIEYRSISEEIEKLDLEDYKEKSPISQIKSTFSQWLSRAPFEIKDLEESCIDYEPDLLIVDVNTWGAAAFAEAQKKPWVMFMPYCLPVPSNDTPAYGPGFAPPQNSIDRVRDKLVRAVMHKAFKGVINKLDEFRTKMGVSKLDAWENLFSKPDILIYLTAEPFEYKRAEWPENLYAVGPGLWAPQSVVPGWIDNLPHPRILVSVSTEMQDDGEIIKAAIKAMENEKGSLIVTTAALDPDQFNTSNDRIKIARYLPHSSIIPKMDVVVTHGGMGMTQRALASGKPLVVVPWGRDQNETARRVEYCGAGVIVKKNKLNPEIIRIAIKEAQDQKSGAERVAQSFSKAGGTLKAVELINGMIRKQVETV